MPIRNLFGRRTAAAHIIQDENVPPSENLSAPGFERVDTVGSKSSSAMSVRSRRSVGMGSYKLSVVNDSGVYLPPSPTEDAGERGLWPRRYMSSRTSSDAHSSTGEIEHFSISRESFDSYRRSFDISARSPVLGFDAPMRQSFDSARFTRPNRYPLSDRLAKAEPTTEEDDFEDVGLDTDADANRPKRKFFSLFESQDGSSTHASAGPGVSRFLPGRKRGHSGTGAELRPMEVPATIQGSEMAKVQVTH